VGPGGWVIGGHPSPSAPFSATIQPLSAATIKPHSALMIETYEENGQNKGEPNSKVHERKFEENGWENSAKGAPFRGRKNF